MAFGNEVEMFPAPEDPRDSTYPQLASGEGGLVCAHGDASWPQLYFAVFQLSPRLHMLPSGDSLVGEVHGPNQVSNTENVGK